MGPSQVKSESEVAQSCPTLHDPMDCSAPGSSVHGIFQARVLEWVAIAFSRLILNLIIFSCPGKNFLKKKSITYLWPFLLSTQKHHLNLGNIIICTSKPSFTHLTNIANAFFKDKAQCWKMWVKQEVIPLLLWKVYNLAGWFKSEDFKIQEQEFPV